MAGQSLIDRGPLLFVAAVFAALVLPALFMDGMFMDGVFYASISRNFANGHGTFWNMQFSDTHFIRMHEQPPLMFAFESVFFRLFSGIYPERIYCAVTAVINSILVVRSWKLITRSTRFNPSSSAGGASTAWLPLLLWIIMPVTFYAFTNNIEECTMTIFALLAFNSILRALFDTSEKKIYWIIAGMWILLAGLTKGIQGMFLLSAPFWCLVVLKNGTVKDFLVRLTLISLVPAAFILVAWFNPVIHQSLADYFTSRFVKTFNNTTANADNHFHILFELLIDTLPTVGVMAIFALTGRKTPGFREKVLSGRRLIYFVFACAFSGIIPLMVTLEQRGFYLVTALPFVAIACALIIQPAAQRLSDYIRSEKTLALSILTFSLLLFVAVMIVTITRAGTFKRDEDKITSLHEVAAITGNDAIIGLGSEIGNDWPLITYAQRYHGLSVTDYRDPQARWSLMPKGAVPPDSSEQIPIKSAVYDLYRRR